MPEFSLRTVRISLAIMTLCGYLALATTDAFGPEIAIVPLILIAAMRPFERLDATYVAYRRISQAVTLAFTIVIVPYLFSSLFSGLTAIILYVQAYLMLHGKGVKEYRYLFLMAFFLLVDAVAQSPNSGFGLVMPAFVLSAVWAFASVQIYAETVANRGGNVADLLPAEFRRGFLPPEVAAWISGGRRDRMTVAPVLAGISMGCVVVTLLFFLFTPRLDAGIFGRNNLLIPTQVSGLDKGVNLSRGGAIATDEEPVFMVRFPDEPSGRPVPFERDFYWRVTSYNRLIGAEWDRIEGDFDFVLWRGHAGRIERRPPESGRVVVQDIFLQDTHDLPGVPALPGVYRFKIPPTARFVADETELLTFHVTESASQVISYEAVSKIPQWSRAQLRAEPAEYPADFDSRIVYRKNTEQRLSQRAQQLAARLTDGLDTPYTKAEAIMRYLQNPLNYAYTTSPDQMSEVDPIDDFLFVTRRGHCELYASAMCMLLRSIGIPSRVVSGFRDGDWSPSDGAYIVRRRHAHLWVEAFVNPRIGWVMFDPSGTADIDASLLGVVKRAWGRYMLMARFAYYRDIIGYNNGIQLRSLIQFSMGLFSFDVVAMKNSIPSLRITGRGLPGFVILCCIGIALVWGFVLMYRSATIRRRSGPTLSFTEDQTRATRLYLRLRRRLAGLGSNTQGISARELVRVVAANPAVDAQTVSRIVRAYNDTRFGGRPMERPVYAELIRAVRHIKRNRRPGDH